MRVLAVMIKICSPGCQLEAIKTLIKALDFALTLEKDLIPSFEMILVDFCR